MPKFKMVYTYARFWPGLGLRCAPGEVIERDDNPDPIHFEEVDASTPVGLPEEAEPEKPAPKRAAKAPAEPAPKRAAKAPAEPTPEPDNKES